MTYNEWFDTQEISGWSLEASCACRAWNAAIKEAIEIVKSVNGAEPTIDRTVLLAVTELTDLLE